MTDKPIYEFIVLREKQATSSAQALISAYDREARRVNGYQASVHFQATSDEALRTFVFIYHWANRATIPVARDHLVSTVALKDLLEAMDFLAFGLTEQLDEAPLILNTLLAYPDLRARLTYRSVKPGQEAVYQAGQAAYRQLAQGHYVHHDFKAVLGNEHEGLYVDMLVYARADEFQLWEDALTHDAALQGFFASFEAQSFYLSATHRLSLA